MANEAMLTPIVSTREPATEFSYPAAALVIAAQNGGKTIHLIVHTAAPSTNFNSAPNGSVLFKVGTGAALYIKDGTPGLVDGTWRTVALA